ncbi:formate dehydrogenase accessory sulfurtransferase FdhD [Wohlfahrtiimonas larvae]|uniref:Sulfur carrier protein FdhD n=1 Tax=Wohlfahrtiimonas larvae TaxID=1157986 RepID=A0ABP9N320_9GAMM|nr:formate dehydrogenase accessory sulfurtransferase FdhD [Wohlfahrtiimonas larvae]
MEAIKKCQMVSYYSDAHYEKDDCLISEEPIQFIYNGVPHLVMMCTPTDLEDLAYGFSLTEGIVQSPQQILSVSVQCTHMGVELHIEIEPILMSRLEGNQRKMSARTGCGVCGVENLSLVEKTLVELASVEPITYESIQNALSQSNDVQKYGQQTGASHAAFLCDRKGDIILTREDVGRHVALDKLIGAMMQSGVNVESVFILMSSRASFEIVQKTIAIKIPILVTMSAPTDKAVQLAKKYHLSLWGFARKGRVNCYST